MLKVVNQQHLVKYVCRVSTQALFALLCLLITHPAYSIEKSIFIIANNNSEIHQHISTQIKKAFSIQPQLSVEIHHYQNLNQQQIEKSQPSLIITLGVDAARLTINSSSPTLMSLIPKRNLQAEGLCITNDCIEKIPLPLNHYAIYLDQPTRRQLNFLSLLLPTKKKIGVLTASFSHYKLQQLEQESRRQGLSLSTRFINNEDELSRKLIALMENIDVLLTLPDPLIHNRNNLPYLLLSTYRYNIPVIGFSKAYVKAGAIAAIYSSPDQLSQQIIELSHQILNPYSSLKSNYFAPKYFSIAINQSVAYSLDLYLPDKQAIKSKLLHLEE